MYFFMICAASSGVTCSIFSSSLVEAAADGFDGLNREDLGFADMPS
jgi:hypothetical protein